MTYDKLLAKLNPVVTVANITKQYNAVRAVVELHQPQDITLPDGEWGENCCICNNGWTYPCRTIQVIEVELGWEDFEPFPVDYFEEDNSLDQYADDDIQFSVNWGDEIGDRD